ncbi:MAG: C4-dicarboxylate ABC transporter permease [Spirochaetes bacterium]|nr:MAG: C4-dicarboxylate ABC transporter permease [Spirochaetota bacterium]
MATILLISLIVLFLINIPLSVSIAGSSIIAIVISGKFPLMMVVQRMVNAVDSFPLMAVPLFMLAGALMDSGGISRRIVNFADSLVGWLSGGLSAVSIVASMFFAGISGSAAADTAAVGAMLIPSMKEKGYKSEFAAAVQAAGGSIGVIIPPSIPMIIYGFITGTSIVKLFAGGILAGVLIGFSLILVAVIISKKNGYGSDVKFSFKNVAKTFKEAVWALGATVIILGGILGGIFTATEAAAVAVIYGFIVGKFVYKELELKQIPKMMMDSAVLASIILFIISAASIFGWILTMENIPQIIGNYIVNLTSNKILLLLLINFMLLIAGTFMETTVSLILLVPIIMPILPMIGMDPVQMGVVVVTNLAIGMLTPPLGICLIVSAGISKDSIAGVSRAIMPFLLMTIADLLILTFWPPITTFLPSLL